MKNLRESAIATRLSQFMLALFIVAGASMGIAGCEQDGPAENIGESFDEGAEEIGDEIDDAT